MGNNFDTLHHTPGPVRVQDENGTVTMSTNQIMEIFSRRVTYKEDYEDFDLTSFERSCVIRSASDMCVLDVETSPGVPWPRKHLISLLEACVDEAFDTLMHKNDDADYDDADYDDCPESPVDFDALAKLKPWHQGCAVPSPKDPAALRAEEINEEPRGGFSSMISKMFTGKGFNVGQVDDDKFAMSLLGLAVRGADGTYRVYDKTKNMFTTVDEFTMDMPGGIFLLPTVTLAVGDIILKSDNVPRYITDVEGNNIEAVNFNTQALETVIPEQNMFGFQIYMKVFSMFNLGGAAGTTAATNPMANMGSMLPMMVMMETMGGSKSSGKNSGFGGDMMSTMMMMSMMGGVTGAAAGATANPFATMFGGAPATPVAQTTTPVTQTTPDTNVAAETGTGETHTY